MLEGATRRGECIGERENLTRHQQIGILGADWMPINPVGGDGDFRDKIGAGKRYRDIFRELDGIETLRRVPALAPPGDEALFGGETAPVEPAVQDPDPPFGRVVVPKSL